MINKNILYNISKKMDVKDYYQLCASNKHLYNMYKDEVIWLYLCERDFYQNEMFNSIIKLQSGYIFYNIYQMLYLIKQFTSKSQTELYDKMKWQIPPLSYMYNWITENPKHFLDAKRYFTNSLNKSRSDLSMFSKENILKNSICLMNDSENHLYIQENILNKSQSDLSIFSKANILNKSQSNLSMFSKENILNSETDFQKELKLCFILNLKRNKRNNKMNMLPEDQHELLEWTGDFQYEGLTRIGTNPSGSCFFCSLAKAYFKPYIVGEYHGKKLNKTAFIQRLRSDFSKLLAQKVNPEGSDNSKSKTYYETLSHGELVKISKDVPEYSLKNMQEELADPTRAVSDIYNEFISDQLNIDIYILSAEKQDVYMTGGDHKLLYKNRPSVVLLYLPGHYELIGIAKNDTLTTYFTHNDPFIKYIRKRMKKLLK